MTYAELVAEALTNWRLAHRYFDENEAVMVGEAVAGRKHPGWNLLVEAHDRLDMLAEANLTAEQRAASCALCDSCVAASIFAQA